jgi:nucleotidyltransferase/DNA polymerase involved in DNA repair
MIACVLIRDFAVSVELQADGALAGVPLLLVEYGKKRGKVAAVSREASKLGVAPGLSLSRARALCPDGHFLTLDKIRQQEALDKVLETLWIFTNRVEVEETAYPQSLLCYLDLGKLKEADSQFLGEKLTQAIQTECGLKASVGLAAGKFPAQVAALSSKPGKVMLVAKGVEAEFVAKSPVSLLPLSKAAAHKLDILCIRTLQELASLPRTAILAQFGRQGKLLYHLACGQDYRPVKPRRMPQREIVSRQFEPALTERARLDVIIHHMADELARRLEARASALQEMRVMVQFESGDSGTERLYLLQPVGSAKIIAQTIYQLLERIKVKQGVAGLEVYAAHLVPSIPRQLELFTHKQGKLRVIDLLQVLADRHGDDSFYEAIEGERGSLLPERRFRLKRMDVS